MLATRDLGKSYAPGEWAVRHLELEVPDGSLVMLLGANGAGKSTTINCFLDFIRPTEGEAMVNAHVVADAPLEAKKHVAFLAETLAVYPALTGLQNLQFFVGLGRVSLQSREESQLLLERMGLPRGAIGRPVREYSKGMRQKLGLAIALARGTGNIILDEPTTGLDPVSARELMSNLHRIRDTGAAVLMSTHDVFRASSGADRVYVMRAGALVASFHGAELSAVDMEHEYLRAMAAA